MPTDHISSFVFQRPTSFMPISTLQKKVSGKVSTTLMLSVRGHVSPHKPSLFPPVFKMDGKTRQRLCKEKASRNSGAPALSASDRNTGKLFIDFKTTYQLYHCINGGLFRLWSVYFRVGSGTTWEKVTECTHLERGGRVRVRPTTHKNGQWPA